jgi:predicted protein tyrosine phosphatase
MQVRAKSVAFGVAALLALAAIGERDLRLTLAFEHRADPNPRQIEIAADLAGLGLALLLSWSVTR